MEYIVQQEVEKGITNFRSRYVAFISLTKTCNKWFITHYNVVMSRYIVYCHLLSIYTPARHFN